jgi:hypothetical protein
MWFHGTVGGDEVPVRALELLFLPEAPACRVLSASSATNIQTRICKITIKSSGYGSMYPMRVQFSTLRLL